jgi:hypothetical protein
LPKPKKINLTDVGKFSKNISFEAPGGSKKTDLKQHYNVMEIATSKSH